VEDGMRFSVLVATLTICISVHAQTPETLLRGRPALKVTVAATEQRAEAVTRADAPNWTCIVSRIGDNLYWASRENTPLTLTKSGAFYIFVADGGAGYIKLIDPTMKAAAALMGGTEAKYDYVEHISFGLGSVSYYGTLEK
jgi:hypothetical protein